MSASNKAKKSSRSSKTGVLPATLPLTENHGEATHQQKMTPSTADVFLTSSSPRAPAPDDASSAENSLEDYLHPGNLSGKGSNRCETKQDGGSQESCIYEDVENRSDYNPETQASPPLAPHSNHLYSAPNKVTRQKDPHRRSSSSHSLQRNSGYMDTGSMDDSPTDGPFQLLDAVGSLELDNPRLSLTATEQADRDKMVNNLRRLRDSHSAGSDTLVKDRRTSSLKRVTGGGLTGEPRRVQIVEVDVEEERGTRGARRKNNMVERPDHDSPTPERLRREIDLLQQTVYRLNVELSGRFGEEGSASLPGRGPVPPWLVNTRYLSPLLAVYDEKLEDKERSIRLAQDSLQEFDAKLKEVIRENERLHTRLRDSNDEEGGPANRAEWEQLIDQAKLVLEENNILIEQLNVQENKLKHLQDVHSQEVSRLSKQSVLLQREKQDLELKLRDSEYRFTEMQSRHDTVLENKEKEELLKSNKQLLHLKKILDDTQRKNDEAVNELKEKMAESKKEHKEVSDALKDTSAERKKLIREVKGLKNSLKESYRKNLTMQQLLKKEITVEGYLENVVTMANEIAEQRDLYAITLKEKQDEYQKQIDKLLDEVRQRSRVEEKHSSQKTKSMAKLENTISQLVEQNEDTKNKCHEQERQVHYLQALLREKEEHMEQVLKEKGLLQEKLENVWNAATNEEC